MNQSIQNSASSDPFGLPKRKRGRPRKDQFANRLAITRVPLQPHGEPTNGPNDGIIGHAVTGVVDAAFDAGYLLSVRIGNATFRGAVFKPGNFAPITLENDVAPHVQMIRRNSTARNGSTTSTNQCLGVEHRATVVPVVLQPASLSNNVTPSPQLTPALSQDLGVNDRVYTVEPLAMLPAVSRGQSQAPPSQPHGNGSSAGPTMPNHLQSAQTHAQDDPGKGPQDPHPCESKHVHPSLPQQSMTDLLLALQENMMENQGIHGESPSSSSTSDHDEESGD